MPISMFIDLLGNLQEHSKHAAFEKFANGDFCSEVRNDLDRDSPSEETKKNLNDIWEKLHPSQDKKQILSNIDRWFDGFPHQPPDLEWIYNNLCGLTATAIAVYEAKHNFPSNCRDWIVNACYALEKTRNFSCTDEIQSRSPRDIISEVCRKITPDHRVIAVVKYWTEYWLAPIPENLQKASVPIGLATNGRGLIAQLNFKFISPGKGRLIPSPETSLRSFDQSFRDALEAAWSFAASDCPQHSNQDIVWSVSQFGKNTLHGKTSFSDDSHGAAVAACLMLALERKEYDDKCLISARFNSHKTLDRVNGLELKLPAALENGFNRVGLSENQDREPIQGSLDRFDQRYRYDKGYGSLKNLNDAKKFAQIPVGDQLLRKFAKAPKKIKALIIVFVLILAAMPLFFAFKKPTNGPTPSPRDPTRISNPTSIPNPTPTPNPSPILLTNIASGKEASFYFDGDIIWIRIEGKWTTSNPKETLLIFVNPQVNRHKDWILQLGKGLPFINPDGSFTAEAQLGDIGAPHPKNHPIRIAVAIVSIKDANELIEKAKLNPTQGVPYYPNDRGFVEVGNVRIDLDKPTH